MKIGLINKSRNPNPSYKTSGSSGLDIRASLDATVYLGPGERRAVSTGIYLELPENFEAQIRPRSGLALNSGITVLNTPGTIDSDYRGEVAVVLINHSKDIFKINNGDRIAQLVIAQVAKLEFNQLETLNQTERGTGGFGSTGVK